MPTKKKSSALNFDPRKALACYNEQAYDASYTFNASTSARARAWQKKVRKLLAQQVGYLNLDNVAPKAKILATVDRGDYVRKKIVIQTLKNVYMPVYLLIPKSAKKPTPTILALHGHGYGARDIVGIWKDNSERLAPEGYQKDFACELAKRGFVVAAPEIIGFGERNGKQDSAHPRAAEMSDCYRLSVNAWMQGGSIQGVKVWENMRLLDYLESLSIVDSQRIGAMGISGGGQNTFYTTALETRIKACVISGYFCEWQGSIMAVEHCICNFIPGMLKFGSLSDLAALIAPRPCLVEHGMYDTDFNVEYTKKAVSRAKKAWKIFGKEQNLQSDIFPGEHRINGKKAYDFLLQHLWPD